MKSGLLLLTLSMILYACTEPNFSKEPSITHFTSTATKDLGLPFSEAVIVDNMIYLSGQIGNLPGTLNLAEGGIRGQAKQVMINIESVLNANDADMDDIIKCTVMIDDISEWGIFNEEYIKFFPGKKPARSAFGADGLALGAAVEVECIACLSK